MIQYEKIEFERDSEIEAIDPTSDVTSLCKLLSYLCGEDVNPAPGSLDLLQSLIRKVRDNGSENIILGREEFNELLLLCNQNRISEPFFNFFFAGERKEVSYSKIASGISKFRGFSMLRFGNFRFAYRKLSEETDNEKFLNLLDWRGKIGSTEFPERRPPLVGAGNSVELIERDDTWLLGYLSKALIDSDNAILDDYLTSDSELSETEKSNLADDITSYQNRLRASRKKGKTNTAKYLTWDYMDVYIATSMRNRWEFEEVFEFVQSVFGEHLDIGEFVRWFDPTQSFTDSIIDKGLVEGLMLKRANCTVYLAQEEDTLGKDSELAATLAQGKPVIAYVEKIEQESLDSHARHLLSRPTSYFHSRLLGLFASEFFDKKDNREAVSKNLQAFEEDIDPEQIKATAKWWIDFFERFLSERTFQVIGAEDIKFKEDYKEMMEGASHFLAASDARAKDVRASILESKHPLSMQINLQTGVANGVIVARTPSQCATLIKKFLTGDLSFRIDVLEARDEVKATVLKESQTNCNFRAVTKDSCLTNSFWNFYTSMETI